MAKKCPPGVFCIENYTLFFVIIIILIVIFFIWKSIEKYNTNIKINDNDNSDNNNTKIIEKETILINNNRNNDVLTDPYIAPLKDERIYLNESRGLPINIPTQGVETAYRQVGILTRINGPETILPLMGRPLIVNRDKWNFYTMNDKNNMIKLPISYKNKSCTNEYGCDNIYNGDTVYVEGYNDAFKVTMYENSTMRYIPYL